MYPHTEELNVNPVTLLAVPKLVVEIAETPFPLPPVPKVVLALLLKIAPTPAVIVFLLESQYKFVYVWPFVGLLAVGPYPDQPIIPPVAALLPNTAGPVTVLEAYELDTVPPKTLV